MIIKMKDGDLLNTDHIKHVEKHPDGGVIIWSNGFRLGISEDEYNELLEHLYP